jgi:hypothetical protein
MPVYGELKCEAMKNGFSGIITQSFTYSYRSVRTDQTGRCRNGPISRIIKISVPLASTRALGWMLPGSRLSVSKLDQRIEAVYTDPPGTTVRQGGTPYCRVPVSCYARGHSSWLSSSAIKSAVVLLLLSIWFPLQHFMRASFLFVRMLGVFYTLHHLGLKRISLLEQLVNTLGVRSWDVG